MVYEYRDDIALADVAFKAWGKDLEELFGEAARATVNVMVEDLTTVVRREFRKVALEEEAEDLLLFDFLQEVIFYKDAEQLLLLPERVRIERCGEKSVLKGVLAGERLDAGRHPLLVDVKAVTMHRFSVARDEQGCRAEVVLDI